MVGVDGEDRRVARSACVNECAQESGHSNVYLDLLAENMQTLANFVKKANIKTTCFQKLHYHFSPNFENVARHVECLQMFQNLTCFNTISASRYRYTLPCP